MRRKCLRSSYPFSPVFTYKLVLMTHSSSSLLMESVVVKKKRVRKHLYHLDIHKSVGADGIHPTDSSLMLSRGCGNQAIQFPMGAKRHMLLFKKSKKGDPESLG